MSETIVIEKKRLNLDKLWDGLPSEQPKPHNDHSLEEIERALALIDQGVLEGRAVMDFDFDAYNQKDFERAIEFISTLPGEGENPTEIPETNPLYNNHRIQTAVYDIDQHSFRNDETDDFV